MEGLLSLDFGVLALTILNFALLVFLLTKFAWKPIIGALEKREEQVRTDKETAQQAREDAQRLKAELDERLANISTEAAQKIAQAVKIGETQKDQLLAQAKTQAEALVNQAREQISAEKDKALHEVQSQIAQLSVLAASRVITQEITKESATRAVEEVLREVKTK